MELLLLRATIAALGSLAGNKMRGLPNISPRIPICSTWFNVEGLQGSKKAVFSTIWAECHIVIGVQLVKIYLHKIWLKASLVKKREVGGGGKGGGKGGGGEGGEGEGGGEGGGNCVKKRDDWSALASHSPPLRPSVISRVNISHRKQQPPWFNYHQRTRGLKQPSWPFFVQFFFWQRVLSVISLFSCASFLILFCSFPRRMVVKRGKVEHCLLLSCRGGRGRSFKVWVWMIQPKSWQIVSPEPQIASKETNKVHWSGQLVFTLCIWLNSWKMLGLFPPESAIDRKGIQGWFGRRLRVLLIVTSSKFVSYFICRIYPLPYFGGYSSFLGHLYFRWN